jgi:uncharacterized RDD family membrane protein YckC
MLLGMSSADHEWGRSLRVSTDLVIETPENVVLTYRLAGPAARLLAYLVDFVIRAALLLAMCVAAAIGAQAGLGGISAGMLLLVIFFLDWAYYGISEGCFRGKTIGKFVFGLRVIQEEGYPITLWGALLRNIVRAADSMPFYLIFPFYGAGFVTMLVAGKFRRLGDLVARTVVIEERRVSVPREPIILEKIESLPRTDLGGYVPSGQTLALIEQFLGRRHVLTYRRGHAMAHVLARALAKKLAYSGDPQLVDRYPMAFLARVYATFYQVREEDDVQDAAEEQAAGARHPRRALSGAVR